MNRLLVEYTPETEAIERDVLESYEIESSSDARAGEVFGQNEQMEFAAGLLEISNEAQLDRFIGDLIAKAGHVVGTFVDSPTGQALGGILKRAAKQALPVVGRALGGHLAGTTGAERGAQFALTAGKLFGLELEGLSPEDQEFEAAKGFVRFAGEAVKNTVRAPAGMSPRAAIQSAVIQAGRRYAPGLLRSVSATRSTPRIAQCVPASSGRWVRRGSNIYIVNC